MEEGAKSDIILNSQKKLDDYFQTQRECAKKGHPDAEQSGTTLFEGQRRPWMKCPTCKRGFVA